MIGETEIQILLLREGASFSEGSGNGEEPGHRAGRDGLQLAGLQCGLSLEEYWGGSTSEIADRPTTGSGGSHHPSDIAMI